MIIPADYSTKKLFNDIETGIIIALISIPISMGYASVAGLSAVYGLYGSLLPPVLFALLSTSPRFVFGVDAAPAALAGGLLASLGIMAGSAQAMHIMPVITLLTAFWLFIFFLLRADRMLKFISQPVMGGFITGIGLTIICMQVPKPFGGTAGSGESVELVMHIISEARSRFHMLSFLLGTLTVAVILAGKRLCPKVPVQALLMAAGMAATCFLHLDRLGVQTLPAVSPGLPVPAFPDVMLLRGHFKDIVLPSLSIATVILSETLLATSNISRKHGDSISSRREIATYAACNLAAAFCGTCPVNGSVSRTGMADQFGVSSQVMSLTAGAVMAAILLFGTGLIVYLPVPVLTGIVISALIGTLEFSLARKLRSVDRVEYLIFFAALAAVLLLGTIYGVIVGVLLSAVTFIIRQSSPSVDFLGIVPGMKGYYPLNTKGSAAVPIKGAVLYRFSGPLFYANITQFCGDIEQAVTEDTKAVVADASGIGSVDATAAEELLALYRRLEQKNIKLYITGHVSSVNDQLRTFGAQELIHRRAVRTRIAHALDDAGFPHPYPADESYVTSEKRYSSHLAEFEWAFGTQAERLMENIARIVADEIATTGKFDVERIRNEERKYSEGYWDEAEEDEFLDVLEIQLDILRADGKLQDDARSNTIEQKINELHIQLEEKLLSTDSDAMRKIIHHRYMRDFRFKEHFPRLYQKIELERERYFESLAMKDPELAKKIAELITKEENA